MRAANEQVVITAETEIQKIINMKQATVPAVLSNFEGIT